LDQENWHGYSILYLGRPVGIAGLFGVEDLVKGSAGFGKPVLVAPTVPVPEYSYIQYRRMSYYLLHTKNLTRYNLLIWQWYNYENICMYKLVLLIWVRIGLGFSKVQIQLIRSQNIRINYQSTKQKGTGNKHNTNEGRIFE
jgi:hypothetical protein